MLDRQFRIPEAVQCETESLTATFGRFFIEPFEQGWGTTVGNALRRVLLSSLSGTAIWAVRVEGVLHEFTSVPGVMEDVTKILLNFKQVRFQMLGEDPVDELELKIQGPGEVTAGDIRVDQRVRVVNPEQHIASLNEKGQLEIRLKLRRSWGYVPAEENRSDTLPVGYIPIDSIHGPVQKVAFKVLGTRVGQSTDYERLTLEVTTDGTLAPQNAISEASAHLRSMLSLFENIEETARPQKKRGREKDEEQASASLAAQWGEKSLGEIGLSSRVIKILENNEIKTVGELLVKDSKDVKKIPGFGRKALRDLSEALEKNGLVLGVPV